MDETENSNRREFLATGSLAAVTVSSLWIGTATATSTGRAIGGNQQIPRVKITTPYRQVTKLTADDGDDGDLFGESIALSGDTALVGARWDENPNGEYAGAAYLFERSEGTWNRQAKLSADDGNQEDEFGYSVALTGDTALIGAPGYEEQYVPDQGAAYVFERSGDTWSQQTKLVPEDNNEDDRLGKSVALVGDTALVGAYTDSEPNGFEAGSAYIFERSDGTWTQQAKLVPDDGDSQDAFGYSVALTDDTALIGAYIDEDPYGEEAGSAYVFERSDGTWTQQAKLLPGDGEEFIRFGESVALDGGTALVGAKRDINPNGNFAGATYVFVRNDGAWTQQAKLTANDGDDEDYLGNAVALSGDTALCGAYRDEDPNGRDAGSAYVFERNDEAWTQQAKLAADDGDNQDKFAKSVTLAGETILVGASNDEDPNGRDAGSAYVFRFDETVPTTEATEETTNVKTTAETGTTDSENGDQGLPGFSLGTALAGLGGGVLWHRLRKGNE